MKHVRQSGRLLVALAGLLLAGCNRAADSDDNEAKQSGPESGVSFKGVRGLQVTAATLKALGIATAEAKEQPVAEQETLMAQVFDAGPPALASVQVSPLEAEKIAARTSEGAKLLRVDHAIEPATHQVELIFALNERGHGVGDFVAISVSAPAASTLAVPRSAVIDGATGSFVYVVNGGYYLRTAVKTGMRDAEWTEVTDGLYAGDVVVTTGAQRLWLAEMRLIKGGADID